MLHIVLLIYKVFLTTIWQNVCRGTGYLLFFPSLSFCALTIQIKLYALLKKICLCACVCVLCSGSNACYNTIQHHYYETRR